MIEFVVGTPGDTTEFNESWRNVVGSAGYHAANNIFSRLVVTETIGRASYPDLAHHWECLDGARRWRFQLNPAARWHDGERLTAHDVEYTHRTTIERGYFGGGFLRDVASIEVIDDHTLDYHLKEPNSGFLMPLGNFAATHVLPRHLWEGTDWPTNPHNQAPVGSGPFRFVEHVPGDRVVMEAWPQYWGPPPGVDRIVMRIVSDRSEILRMIRDGEVDYCTHDVLTMARLNEAPETATRTVSREKGPGIACLSFNYHRDRWRDRRLREAVAVAVNRDNLQRFVDPGWSTPWDHYLPGGSFAVATDISAPAYDRARAVRLLDECGLAPDAEGVRLRLTGYYMETFDGHGGYGESVSRDLAEVGIEVQFAPLASAAWLDRVGTAHDFDVTISGGNMLPDPDITASRFQTGGSRNVWGLSNPVADECYRLGRAAISIDERIPHYRRLQQAFADDISWVPLFWYNTYAYRSKEYFGWSDEIDGRVPWWHWGRIRPV